jgi:hypothetical protein
MTAVVKMPLKSQEMGNAHMFNVVASEVFSLYSSLSHEDIPYPAQGKYTIDIHRLFSTDIVHNVCFQETFVENNELACLARWCFEKAAWGSIIVPVCSTVPLQRSKGKKRGKKV